MLFIRARVVSRLLRHIKAMNKQGPVQTGGDKSQSIRDNGVEMLTYAVNQMLDLIRNTVENGNEGFFF